jgi:thiol-disulfide isomerase/thioredoxin
MLRHSAVILLFILAVTGCKNNTIVINGKLEGPASGKYILLDELKADDLVTVDSVLISDDGLFSLERKLEHPAFYLLKTDNTNFLTLLLEPGQLIELSSHVDSLNYPRSLTGSEGSLSMLTYNRRLLTTINELKALNEVYMQNLDTPELSRVMESLDTMAQKYLNDINDYTKKYIDENLSSLVSLVALYQQVAPGEYIMNPERDLEYFIKVDSSLFRLYPDYAPVISLHEQVAQLRSTIAAQQGLAPGAAGNMIAPDIALPNPEGDTISLSSLRGSVVLLDIWAAWCPPCRAENPNLVKAFNKYSGKGFTIYQVSLDKTRDAWLDGISTDKLDKWIHVSDLNYWNSVVVPMLGIESIPANFLIDREGKIIDTNLRGERLEQRLAEIFE